MAQEVKVLAPQAWRPMFNPQYQHKGGRRELTSGFHTCTMAPPPPSPNPAHKITHTHTHINKVVSNREKHPTSVSGLSFARMNACTPIYRQRL